MINKFVLVMRISKINLITALISFTTAVIVMSASFLAIENKADESIINNFSETEDIKKTREVFTTFNKIKIQSFYKKLKHSSQKCDKKFDFIKNMYKIGKLNDYRANLEETSYYCKLASEDIKRMEIPKIEDDFKLIKIQNIYINGITNKKSEIALHLYNHNLDNFGFETKMKEISKSKLEADSLYEELINKY